MVGAMRRWWVAVGVAATVMAAAMIASPSADAGGAPRFRGVITFVKNDKRPDDSRLTWSVKKRETANGKTQWVQVDSASWRAGSGMGGKRGTNSCIHNVGWLPNGTYHVRQYANYDGTLIKGRAFRVDDKRCPNGTLRFDLFIHTEQGSGNTQCPNRPGDQPCRWEYPQIDDYHSHGCIKLAPGDLASLVHHYREHFRTGRRYAKNVVELHVVNG
jgi:hypothetical protein